MSIRLVLSLLLALAPLHAAAEERAWRFRVWLDEREIGYHEFVLETQGAQRLMRSEASFEYRMLFIRLFDYQHENLETWDGNCLSRIESRTDANGRFFEVRGELENGRFLIREEPGDRELPACIMSFAYWNPEFLKEQHLLNTQNGDFVEVSVSPPQAEQLQVRGTEQTAYRYRLQAGKMQLDLWYSEDRQWLALETDARGGRRLRYELL
jgi:hypothetical protein